MAPEADGWELVERLLADLDGLRETLWLVVDDLHELGPTALRQLELLVLRAPVDLRFVLSSRHDVRLGLRRLRLEGELLTNYSPTLAPLENGSRLLEITTRKNSDGTCLAYVASAAIAPLKAGA